MMMVRLPPRGDGPITLMIQEPAAPHVFARSQLQLNRSTADIVKWEPYAAASAGRKFRTWVRALHTGEAFGVVGQTVAGLASLGGCFLVWTGLAMAWRRFRYRKRTVENAAALPSYSATEPASPREILVPWPNRVEIIREPGRIKMELTAPNSTNGHARDGHGGGSADRTTAPYNKNSVLILYGTVTGTAEALAKKVATALGRAGVSSRVRDMAHCQPNVLTQAHCVLMVVSTYGDGEPPDDAAPFWEAVVHGNGLDLRGVKFSVLALGNTTYDHFCKCGREFDAALERHGATRFYPRVDCDVDYDETAERWIDGVLASLAQDKRLAASA
jgi:sulfite reductase (NADPH) flavoprotein alpha-component